MLWSSTYQWQVYIITSVVILTSYHYITVGIPAFAGLCLCLSVCKPDWPCWMRILQTGWHVVYRLVLSPFTHWFSAHISEDSSSAMAPRDVLWQGIRERDAKWIQGWAKRSFQTRLQREGREGRRDTQLGFTWIQNLTLKIRNSMFYCDLRLKCVVIIRFSPVVRISKCTMK